MKYSKEKITQESTDEKNLVTVRTETERTILEIGGLSALIPLCIALLRFLNVM